MCFVNGSCTKETITANCLKMRFFRGFLFLFTFKESLDVLLFLFVQFYFYFIGTHFVLFLKATMFSSEATCDKQWQSRVWKWGTKRLQTLKCSVYVSYVPKIGLQTTIRLLFEMTLRWDKLVLTKNQLYKKDKWVEVFDLKKVKLKFW